MATRRTRRHLLTALGLTVVGGAAVGLGSRVVGRGIQPPEGPHSPTPSPPMASAWFDLYTPGGSLMIERLLSEPTVMQSFAIDNANQRLFTVQLVGTGWTLGTETERKTGTQRAAAGDLCVTELTLDGAVVSSMYLLGFGHGVQVGVEPVGQDSYLWTEADAQPENGIGWGRRVARVAYRPGAVVYPDDASVHLIDPVPGATHVAIAIDATNRVAALRFRLNGEFRFLRTDLDTLLIGEPLDVSTSIADPRVGYPAQGFATYGRYLYVLEGGTEDGAVGRSYISRTEWEGGLTREVTLVSDGSGVRNREPEGMALYQPDPKDPDQLRLCFGIGSGAIGDRRASIYLRLLTARVATPEANSEH